MCKAGMNLYLKKKLIEIDIGQKDDLRRTNKLVFVPHIDKMYYNACILKKFGEDSQILWIMLISFAPIKFEIGFELNELCLK